MLLAYHGDPKIKAKYQARIEAHYAKDQIIHGTYWSRGKGCAVGCTVHSADHLAYERELGIPVILAKLEDRIFEGIANGDAKEFPRRFLAAVQVGADLSGVWPRFALWLMIDEKRGVRQYTKEGTPRREAIERVASLFARQVCGEIVRQQEWKDAAAAADAAAYAADAADADADADAAAYAADAAAAADADAAAYAADAAAASARVAFYKAAAEKLLELLAAAPVPVAA